MQLSKMTLALLTIVGCIICGNTFAQSGQVLRVKSSNCAYNTKGATTNFATGFVYKENGKVVGIVTALHAVCGCSSISAEDNSGKDYYSLKVTKADIGNDVALLTSNDILSSFSTGLEFSTISSSILANKKVSMYAYPYGVELNIDTKNARVRETPTALLNKFVKSNVEASLKERGSPNINKSVLNLELEITPGCSGAPILYENKVIGVANGGLDEGRTHVCWAIPTKSIQLSPINSLGQTYTNLCKINPNMLFVLTCNLDATESIQNYVFDWLVPPSLSYKEVEPFKGGFSRVWDGRTFGFVDKSGIEVIPRQFQYARNFSEGIAWVRDFRQKWGGINKNGDLIISYKNYDYVAVDFNEGISVIVDYDKVEDDYMTRFVDKQGNYTTSFKGDYVVEDAQWVEGRLRVQKGFYDAFIDRSGHIVIPWDFGIAGEDFSEGLVAIRDDNSHKTGCIDKYNRLVISYKYETIEPFSNGYAIVQLEEGGNYGYINKFGDLKIPCMYKDVHSFEDDVAWVKYNGNWMLINKKNQPLNAEKYQEVGHFYMGLSPAKKNGKWGFVDKYGGEVVSFIHKFDSIDEFSEGVAWVQVNNKWGIISFPKIKNKN